MKASLALIIMAKAPIAGQVKTRLKGHMSGKERARLYRTLLEGTVGKLRDLPGIDTYITFWPEDWREYFSGFGLPAFPQEGDGLGPRMHNALKKVLGMGYEKAVLVGADIPELSGDVVAEALGLLSDSDIVFGPAEDGGYYLVGLKRPRMEIFEGITWSEETTLSQTLRKADALGLRAALAKTLYDIDAPEDLKRLKGAAPEE